MSDLSPIQSRSESSAPDVNRSTNNSVDSTSFAKLGSILALALAVSFQLTLFGFAILEATSSFHMPMWGWVSLAVLFLVVQLAFLATLVRLNWQNKQRG